MAKKRLTDPKLRARDAYTKRRALLRKYGLTPELYDQLFVKQGFKCAICERKQKKVLHVDHDHKTGEVRGLLCFRCNYGMSWFQHDPALFTSACAYLVDPPARSVLNG